MIYFSNKEEMTDRQIKQEIREQEELEEQEWQEVLEDHDLE